MDNNDIIKALNSKLDQKRFNHTMGVANTAACLAMSEGYDVGKAYLAGLLHDCAKYMTDDEYIAYCEKHDIEMTDVERLNPALLHSKAGAYIAGKKYGVTDEEVISAIRWHTTGHPGMTKLEAIVFLADYIEPNRDHDPELKRIRLEAFDDIDRAIYHVYVNTLKHLNNSGKSLDPATNETYLYYKELLSGRD